MPRPRPTRTASPTPTPPTPTAPPTPEPIPEHLGVSGLFTDPRPSEPDEVRSLAPPPDTEFPEFPPNNTVLYDTWTGQALDLGPGTQGSFSADGQRLAWSSGATDSPELRVMRLSDLSERVLGPGRFAHFVGDEICTAPPNSNDLVIVDPTTGTGTPVDQCDAVGRGADNPGPLENGDYAIRDVRGFGSRGQRRFEAISELTGDAVLTVDALQVILSGDDELLVATPWTRDSTNIFVVDIPSRSATYVATAALHGGPIGLSANDRFLLWTDEFCGQSVGFDGSTSLYERDTGFLIEIDRALHGTFTPTDLSRRAGAGGPSNSRSGLSRIRSRRSRDRPNSGTQAPARS